VFPELTAVVHGRRETQIRRTWREVYARSRQLAHALARTGIGRGDSCRGMFAEQPEMVEAHYGIPMARCRIECAETPRLDATSIAFMLEQAKRRPIIVDREFARRCARRSSS